MLLLYDHLFFQIIEVFGFSIGYNSKFEIYEKKMLKIGIRLTRSLRQVANSHLIRRLAHMLLHAIHSTLTFYEAT